MPSDIQKKERFMLAAVDPPFKGNLPLGQAGKFLEQFQKGYYNFSSSEVWAPSVNLYESESAYLVCVDLAGVEKTKIDIEVVDQRLTIRGARLVPTCDALSSGANQNRRVRMHLMEIDHGPFAREVELPQDVMHASITARQHNGMLWIELPKKP